MRIQVHLFSHLRLALGRRDIELDLPAEATVATVMDRLCDMVPADVQPMIVGGQEGGYRLVALVNERRATPERPLHEGDVLALLPPLGGG